MNRRLAGAFAKRLAVALVVVGVVLAVAAALPAATDSTPSRERIDTPEYDAASLAATPVPADGAVAVADRTDARDGVVVFDLTHANRFDRRDIAPLVEAVTRLGYEVRFHRGEQNLHQALSDANAFVVVDPAEEFEQNEFTTVRTFTQEGGHLLMVGEPTRVRVAGSALADEESALTTLAARYDMSLGSGYLYNLETNGGNYKHVVAEPPPGSGVAAERVTMFTAAPVHSNGGTVLLRTPANTHQAGLDGTAQYPVAIHKERENVVLVGDKSFLRADRYNVGDNEQFVAFLVEFLVTGAASEQGQTTDATDTTATPSPTAVPEDAGA